MGKFMDTSYTIQQVADKLGLSPKTLRRWEEAGRFVGSRTLGAQRRYSLEDIQILDALKHGTISSQKELLTLEQAASYCGVSPTTLTRWEDEGKIHPFITAGRTFYPISRLRKSTSDPIKDMSPAPYSSDLSGDRNFSPAPHRYDL
jgi:predicted site-specific integrase-resolvase